MSDNCPEDFPLTASAKTTVLKALLLRGFTEAPFDKVILHFIPSNYSLHTY
jgi:hypothetical protein